MKGAIISITIGYSVAACTSSSGPPGTDAATDSSGTSSGASVSGSSSGAGSGGSGSSSTDASASDAGGSTTLQWYYTCGDPVCMAPSSDAGGLTDEAGAPCPDVGSSCSGPGDTCGTRDPGFNCGAIEVCAASDPTKPPDTCPISSRGFKDRIHYVDTHDLETLHDETLQLRLAKYHYKPIVSDPNGEHLGFIIEDTPQSSPAVDARREHVDLYGYMSMLLATIQVQETEIAELRHEVEQLRQPAKSGH